MSVEENKALVRREQAELWNHTGNLDAAAELFAPDRVEDAKQEAANVRQRLPRLRKHHRGPHSREGQGSSPLEGPGNPPRGVHGHPSDRQ